MCCVHASLAFIVEMILLVRNFRWAAFTQLLAAKCLVLSVRLYVLTRQTCIVGAYKNIAMLREWY